jgi:hypothetical protein
MWSRFELVPGPDGIQDAFTCLENAIRSAAEGDAESPVMRLREIDCDGLREWYVDHAQVAGTRRVAILRSRSDAKPVENHDRPAGSRCYSRNLEASRPACGRMVCRSRLGISACRDRRE